MSAYHKDGLRPGTALAEYTIESVLGHGGFGITYLARDTSLGAHVAIKEYLPQDVATRDTRTGAVVPRLSREAIRDYRWGLKSFLKEARALARFKHPNIVRVLRFLEANGTAYTVMEYEQGRTLAEHLKQSRQRLDEPALLRIVMPILNGLQAVHEARLLHLDIKPENIYLRRDGSPMLIDFGSARHAMSGAQGGRTALTHGYAPVEQYPDKGTLGPWSDVYAVGATMYRCITGKRPDSALDRYRALLAYKVDPLRPVAKGAKGEYTPLLLDCVQWAMQVHAKDRPQSARQLQDRLLGRGRVATAPTLGAPHKPRAVPAASPQTVTREAATSGISPWALVVFAGLVLAGAFLWSIRADLPGHWQALIARLPSQDDTVSAAPQREPAPATRSSPPSPAVTKPPASRTERAVPAARRVPSVPASLRGVLRGHADWVQSLAFAPDGTRMASAGNDRTVRIWDIGAGAPIATLAHTHAVTAVAYAPDGRILATTSVDGVLRLWDAARGELLQAFPVSEYALYGLAYSPDGQRVAAAGKDRTVYVWHAARGAIERKLEGARGEIYALAYAPDGRAVAAASTDRTIRLWDVATGAELTAFAGYREAVLALAFSPDGKWLAAGDAQPAVRLWDRRERAVRQTLTDFERPVLAVTFAPNGSWLAAASADGGVHLFETETGRLLQTLRGHEDYVQTVAVSRDGSLVASGSRDQSIRIWALP